MIDLSEFHVTAFDDGRGKYADRICARVPVGFREQVKAAANCEGVPAHEFIRRALSERVARVCDGA